MKVIVVRWLKNKWQLVNNEVIELSEAAGYKVIDTIQFITDHPHPKMFIPKMKLDQLIDQVSEFGIDKVVVDGHIRPRQIINLEELLDLEILDKSLLVLEIFERKANSKEIQLQIQLAQLKYNLPKTRLQIGEGVKSERPGFGGSGETVTELFLSDIQSRMGKLENRIEKIKIQKLRDATLSEIPKLPIIGYYSSGKSTLFNILTDGEQNIGAEAFTTMILKSGRSSFAGYPIDLVDTVGLVDLPRDVLTAFDLMLKMTFVFPGIILCIDSSLSDSNRESQYSDLAKYFGIFTTEEDKKKVLVAITKTDLVEEDTLDNIIDEIYDLDFLDNVVIIKTNKNDPNIVKEMFLEGFEELFGDELLSFNFPNVPPKFINKLFNVSRIEGHGWNSDGTGFISGIGIKSMLTPIIGEIKNENG